MPKMYVVTGHVNIPGKPVAYNLMPGDVGTMSMKFSRYPHIEFNLEPSVIRQLSKEQMELIKNAENLLIRLQNKLIKVSDDDSGWSFSHVNYDTSNPSTVFAVCEKKVSKYISLNDVKERNNELFKSPVAIKSGKSYIVLNKPVLKPDKSYNLVPGMVGTFDSNDTFF